MAQRRRLGADFSGMEVVRVALANTGFKVRHRFASENMHCARTLSKHVFPDVETRSVDIVDRLPGAAPSVDMYDAGVPCQPWAQGGRGRGLADSRGLLWNRALLYVSEARP